MKRIRATACLILLFFISSSSYAKHLGEWVPSYQIIKNEKDPSLTNKETIFLFYFKNIPLPAKIIGSCNARQKTISTSGTGEFCLKVIPGKYIYQFFYNDQFYEIYTDSIEAKPGYKIEINIYFESSLYPMIMDKPVIYCYPNEKTNIHINLDLKGEMLFTYPPYKNGWDFSADPNGTMHMQNKEYKYLFWEGSTNINYNKIKWNEGSIVSKDHLLNYFESSLTQMGMNSSEQQDFITYWYPLMCKNEKNYIHFVFNEDYNEYANLTITPKPDNMLRVYMLWTDATYTRELQLEKQEIPSIKRGGFTFVEWGGSRMTEMPEIGPTLVSNH